MPNVGEIIRRFIKSKTSGEKKTWNTTVSYFNGIEQLCFNKLS